MSQDNPKVAQDAPKVTRDSPKDSQFSKMSVSLRRERHVPRESPSRRVGETCPSMGTGSALASESVVNMLLRIQQLRLSHYDIFQNGPKLAPRWPKMDHDDPKMAPRWPQDGPKRPKMAPRRLKQAQRLPLRNPNMAPRWPQDGPQRPQDGPRLNTPQRCPKTAPRQPRDASRWPQDTLSGGPFRGTPRKICSKRARLSGGSRAGTARKTFKSYCLNLDVSLKLFRGVARRGPLERLARSEQIFRGVRHRGPPEIM